MNLSENTFKAALLGTATHRFSSESPFNSASMPDASAETQLLLSIAADHLREQAGYLPQNDHRPMGQPCAPEKTSPCSAKAMRHLRLLVSGIHRSALKEWLIAANWAYVHAHADIVPKLLHLGLSRPHLRPYLLSVVGERGLWLAAEINNQNWKWVFDTPQHTIQEVIEFERLQERDLIAQLRNKSLERLNLEFETWKKYQLVWSHELMDALLTSLEKVPAPRRGYRGWGNYLPDLLTSFAYFFPLDLYATIQQRIKRAAVFSNEPTDLAERIQVIFEFRQAMLNAIYYRED